MREVQKLLLVLAGGLLVLGFGLGAFKSVAVDSDRCGSAFFGEEYGSAEECDSLRTSAQTLPIVLISLGLIAGLGAVVTRSGA